VLFLPKESRVEILMNNEFQEFTSLVDMLFSQSDSFGERLFAEFLGEDGNVESTLSFSELYSEARNIALDLVGKGVQGKNVILLYPPGLEYIKAFFACMCAGATPVPAYPPMGEKDIDRLIRIIKDCDAELILSQSMLTPMIQYWINSNAEKTDVTCCSTDTIAITSDVEFAVFKPNPDDIAFLQYTSGSTGHPKGVMVSHRNLLENFKSIAQCFMDKNEKELGADHYKTVIWLPPFHDMGLIGGILMPLYLGSSVTLMSPLTFLKTPYIWLKAISDRKAKFSGGPNFSYQYCVRKITPEQRDSLDLSHWDVAFNGAEPIQAASLRSFSEYFSSTGFKDNAFLPCYGLAEATLFVAGSPQGRGMLTRPTCLDALAIGESKKKLATNKRAELVSSGVLASQTLVEIVNPSTNCRVESGKIGEIWVNSPSVCAGYWGKPQYSEKVFRATIKNDENANGGMTYLRTGDLGFMDGGELFVTGRLKEVVIVAGRNHYPQDLELSFQKSSELIRKGCGAAFTVPSAEGEQLVVVQEVSKMVDLTEDEWAKLALKGAGEISSRHGVSAKSIVFIAAGSLPKTSSGKIQRVDAKRQYEANQLKVIYCWGNKTHQEVKPKKIESKVVSLVSESQQDLQEQMLSWLANHLNVDSHLLDLDLTFSELGLDSIDAIALVDLLQEFIGRTIPATELLRYPTVNALIKHFSIVRHRGELDGSIQHLNKGNVENEGNEAS